MVCRPALNRRFSNGLTFQASWTWSHTIDNSTADFHTSDITPRRPQDFQDTDADRSTSAFPAHPPLYTGGGL